MYVWSPRRILCEMFQSNYALGSVVKGEAIRYDIGETMNSASQNRAFLRIPVARVAVVGAVATGAAFGLAACGDNADSEMTPSETSMEMSTEKMDGEKNNK